MPMCQFTKWHMVGCLLMPITYNTVHDAAHHAAPIVLPVRLAHVTLTHASYMCVISVCMYVIMRYA